MPFKASDVTSIGTLTALVWISITYSSWLEYGMSNHITSTCIPELVLGFRNVLLFKLIADYGDVICNIRPITVSSTILIVTNEQYADGEFNKSATVVIGKSYDQLDGLGKDVDHS